MNALNFAELLAAPPIPRAELARRAGVSRNTEWSLRQDQSRARVDTLREIAFACGFDVEIRLTRAYQPPAAAAARDLLGDLTGPDGELPEHSLGTPHMFGMDPAGMLAELGPWRERLLRYVHAENEEAPFEPLGLLSEAAMLAAPQSSPEAIMLAGRNDLERLMSAGTATSAEYGERADVSDAFGHRFAFSGGAALQAVGAELPVDLTTFTNSESEYHRWAKMPTVVWTSLPTEFSRYLSETHRLVNTERAATVIIAPLSPHHLVRAAEPGGVPLVSPIQAVIDSLGIGGDLGLTAMNLAEGW